MDAESLYKNLIQAIETHHDEHKKLKESADWFLNSEEVFKNKLTEIEHWIERNRPNFQTFEIDLENIKNEVEELKNKAIDIVNKLIEDFKEE